MVYENVCMITSLPTKRFSAILQWKHLSKFYPQDGGESQLASKLRHCHPVYTWRVLDANSRLLRPCQPVVVATCLGCRLLSESWSPNRLRWTLSAAGGAPWRAWRSIGVVRRRRTTIATFRLRMTTNGATEYVASLTYSNGPYMKRSATAPGRHAGGQTIVPFSSLSAAQTAQRRRRRRILLARGGSKGD